ncbi:MAG: hypothetical protein Q7K43_05005 [Candidatus Woesearchaeota archaeon]|nr:hypothetical protein [Candidatus Woesearchaeota archaeon]
MNLESALSSITRTAVLATAFLASGCVGVGNLGDITQKGPRPVTYTPKFQNYVNPVPTISLSESNANELGVAVLEDYLSCGELARPYWFENGFLKIGQPVVSQELQEAKAVLRGFRENALDYENKPINEIRAIIKKHMSRLSDTDKNEDREHGLCVSTLELLDTLKNDDIQATNQIASGTTPKPNFTAFYIADVVNGLLNNEGILPSNANEKQWFHVHQTGTSSPSRQDRAIEGSGVQFSTVSYDSGRIQLHTNGKTQEFEIANKGLVYQLDLAQAYLFALHDSIEAPKLDKAILSLKKAEDYFQQNFSNWNKEALAQATGFVSDRLLARKAIAKKDLNYQKIHNTAIRELTTLMKSNDLRTKDFERYLLDDLVFIHPRQFFYSNGIVGLEQDGVCKVQVEHDKFLKEVAAPEVVSSGFQMRQDFDGGSKSSWPVPSKEVVPFFPAQTQPVSGKTSEITTSTGASRRSEKGLRLERHTFNPANDFLKLLFLGGLIGAGSCLVRKKLKKKPATATPAPVAAPTPP